MTKTKTFWFKTPKRRSTKNITWHKVWWTLSWWDCKIIKSNRFHFKTRNKINYSIKTTPIALFESNVSIIAIGWYFKLPYNWNISLNISYWLKNDKKIFNLEWWKWYAIWLDLELDLWTFDKIKIPKASFSITIESDQSNYVDYKYFQYWEISYDYYVNNDVYSHFSNSKKF